MFSYKKQNKKTDEIFNWGVLVCLNGQEDEKKEIQEKKKKKNEEEEDAGSCHETNAISNISHASCAVSYRALLLFQVSSILQSTALNRETERERKERDRDRGLAG